jgi:hypothetical protein
MPLLGSYDIDPSDAKTTGPPPDLNLHNLTLNTADSCT